MSRVKIAGKLYLCEFQIVNIRNMTEYTIHLHEAKQIIQTGDTQIQKYLYTVQNEANQITQTGEIQKYIHTVQNEAKQIIQVAGHRGVHVHSVVYTWGKQGYKAGDMQVILYNVQNIHVI